MKPNPTWSASKPKIKTCHPPILFAAIAMAQNDETERQNNSSSLWETQFSVPSRPGFCWRSDNGNTRGGLAEGLKIWDLCIREANRTESFNGAVHCAVAGLDALIWLAPPDIWAAWQEQVRSTLTHPAVDPDIKQLYSIHLMMAEAIGAARSSDLTRAEALLSQIEALDDSLNPLDTRSTYVREIRREIAIASRNAEQLSLLLQALPTNEDAPWGRSCLSLWNEFRILQALDQRTAASEVAQRVLGGECRPIPQQTLIDVQLQADLAENALQDGNLEAATAMYVIFGPTGLSRMNTVVMRIQAIEEQLNAPMPSSCKNGRVCNAKQFCRRSAIGTTSLENYLSPCFDTHRLLPRLR